MPKTSNPSTDRSTKTIQLHPDTLHGVRQLAKEQGRSMKTLSPVVNEVLRSALTGMGVMPVKGKLTT